MLDLNEIAKHSLKTSKQRIENGATFTKDNLKHCAEEVVESVQAREFYKANVERLTYDKLKELKHSFADELMDIIVCVLVECAEHNIDVEDALLRCINKNNKRAMAIGDKL